MQKTKENSEDLWDGRVIHPWSIKEHKKYEKEFCNKLVALTDKELINAYNTHCTSVSGVTVTIYRRVLIRTLEERFDVGELQKKHNDGTESFSFGKSITLIDGIIKIL